MKKHIRHIHPLCWLVLLWLVVAWIETLENVMSYSRDSSVQHSIEMIIVAFVGSSIIIAHLIIYEIAFRLHLSKSKQWLIIFAQSLFVIILTQISQNTLVAFTFSLVLLVASMEILKQLRLLLLASSCFFGLMFLYIHTLGFHLNWLYLWQADNTIFEIPELVITIGLMFYLQQRRAHERTQVLLHDLHTAHEQLAAYALRMEELTMLTERQRIARELHDTLVQGLAGLVMQLDVVNNHLQTQRVERAQTIMPYVIETARDALTDARCALGDLRSGSVRPDDLREVLQEEISRFAATTEIACEVSIESLSITPAPYCEHIVRVIGEALANVKRHAQAKHVWIIAWQEERSLIIEIRDDGKGFDPVLASTKAGRYGLLGIYERAKLIGGHLELQSQSGQGTKLHLSLPLSPVSHEGAKEICQVNLSGL